MKNENDKKKTFIAERNHVAGLLADAVQDISENGGDIHMFSKCLFIAALELEQELVGAEAVHDGLMTLARDINARSDTMGSC